MTGAPGARAPRFGAGDGIRALACMYVVVHHVARHTGSQSGARDPIAAFGDTGELVLWGARTTPYLFFALSGYLLGRAFARSIVGGTRLPSIKRYARSRFLRIVPAFWLAWTLTFLIEGTRGASFSDVVIDYSFLQTLHPNPATSLMVQGWTLSVELMFYFALPLAALALWYVIPRLPRGFSRATWLLVGLGIGGLVSLYIRSEWGHPVWKALFPEYLIAFTPGLLLAAAEPVWANRVRGSQAVRRLTPLLVLIAGAALVWHASLRGNEFVDISVSGTLFAGCLVGGALLREWNSGESWRFFNNPVGNWLGERSYGIYVLHYLVLRQVSPVGDGMDSLGGAFLVRAAVAIPVTLVAADLSYRFLERPIMEWGKRERRRGRAAPTQPEMIAP